MVTSWPYCLIAAKPWLTMIRIVLAFFVFALLVCGLIVFRPFSDDLEVADPLGSGTMIEDVEVTRAPTTTDPVLAAIDAVVEPAVVPAVVEAPRPRAVTNRPATNDTSMDEMTAAVLAELGFAVDAPEDPTGEQAQINSTATILAGIQNRTGAQVDVGDRQTLDTLIVAAIREGQTDEAIDQLVNDAAAAGEVTVPEVMVTSDGRVDTSVLLQNLITQATLAAGGQIPEPVIDPTQEPGVEVRVVQRATDTNEARFYTVQSGDSLGAIAIKFYGRVDFYDRIYQANRQILSSPDLIRTGQRLVIPPFETL